ncbi:MAG TPA: NUDIX domain-containing protein [Streptosporangiaceae bacterium]
MAAALPAQITSYQPQGAKEARDLDRILSISEPDPWLREIPLHLTGSAIIVHPESGRVLLRWHERQQAWLQVGGHGDPGESDPLAVALREATEETGLTDLVPWPAPDLIHVVVVQVPAGRGEPAHEHADLRFVLATGSPEQARAETAGSPVRWLSLADAIRLTSADNLAESLSRLRPMLAAAAQASR